MAPVDVGVRDVLAQDALKGVVAPRPRSSRGTRRRPCPPSFGVSVRVRRSYRGWTGAESACGRPAHPTSAGYEASSIRWNLTGGTNLRRTVPNGVALSILGRCRCQGVRHDLEASLYDDNNRVAPHWPRGVPRDDAGERVTKRRKLDEHLMASPQVVESVSRTLSMWRHGFEPRWDYGHKAPGQHT